MRIFINKVGSYLGGGARAQNRGNLPRTGVYIAETGLIGFAAIGLAIFLSRKKSGKKS